MAKGRCERCEAKLCQRPAICFLPVIHQTAMVYLSMFLKELVQDSCTFRRTMKLINSIYLTRNKGAKDIRGYIQGIYDQGSAVRIPPSEVQNIKVKIVISGQT